MPDSAEGACSAAAVAVAWVCVGFVAVIAVLAHSMVWAFVAVVALTITVACTLAAADRVPFRANSTSTTAIEEDDERVGSTRRR